MHTCRCQLGSYTYEKHQTDITQTLQMMWRLRLESSLGGFINEAALWPGCSPKSMAVTSVKNLTVTAGMWTERLSGPLTCAVRFLRCPLLPLQGCLAADGAWRSCGGWLAELRLLAGRDSARLRVRQYRVAARSRGPVRRDVTAKCPAYRLAEPRQPAVAAAPAHDGSPAGHRPWPCRSIATAAMKQQFNCWMLVDC